ncbi:hypothetical protein Spla01_00868 [Streptomyces platensis]|uniref:Uncharacterized protein n=1 Tax=Streptomyces platensis TaxID=58346 RepID=A0ABX3XZP2_STRPT|nr:hypothetical protein BG653_02289 [Streptomyces platensis]
MRSGSGIPFLNIVAKARNPVRDFSGHHPGPSRPLPERIRARPDNARKAASWYHPEPGSVGVMPDLASENARGAWYGLPVIARSAARIVGPGPIRVPGPGAGLPGPPEPAIAGVHDPANRRTETRNPRSTRSTSQTPHPESQEPL